MAAGVTVTTPTATPIVAPAPTPLTPVEDTPTSATTAVAEALGAVVPPEPADRGPWVSPPAAADSPAVTAAPAPSPSPRAPVTSAPTTAGRAAPAASPASPPAAQQPAPSRAAGCDISCRGERIRRQAPVDPPPGWDVRFEPGRNDDVMGTTSPSERRIRVFIRDRDSDADLLFTLLHEYGHAYDIDYFDRSRRHKWAEARGYRYDRWSPDCHECDDLAYPAGDWAESFAYCHTGDAGRFRSRLAGVPSAEQCDLLHRLSLPPGHPDAPPPDDEKKCRGNLLGRRCR